ncbi:hypothetical protein [Urbifossiella limnaea]|uniref:hypothetical protein n=1 Tax=Urbifossiella limnaea TaxID=2528023 RepID=UPI00119F334D|nr:hypothetical protein [Urbifossiella limnaea]
MSKPTSRGHSTPVAALRLPAVVTALLNDPVFCALVPAPPRRGRIGVAGEFVVVGVADYLAAVEREEVDVHAVPVGDPDEDPAVVQMFGAKDLLPEARNELAMGRAYVVTEQVIKAMPPLNSIKDKTAYKRKHTKRRSERLYKMWREVFGVSRTHLCRYAGALAAPAEVRRQFLAGHLRLDDVLRVVAAGAEVARRVDQALRAGVPVGEVRSRHLGGGSPAAVTGTLVGFVKSMHRWSKVLGPLEGEPPELTREQDRTLRKAGELIARLRQKAG